MIPTKNFLKSPVQIKARDAAKLFREVLFEGGSRSGKTFIAIFIIVARAWLNPGSRHLIVRKHFSHAKTAIWHQTLPEVMRKAFPAIPYKKNSTDFFITIDNPGIDGPSSEIWIGGTDDAERIEKILGTEWATIFMSEISQQEYSTYELLVTRLNPLQGMRPLFLFDQNPGSKRHWAWFKFHLNHVPGTKSGEMLPENVIDNQIVVKMNPIDNVVNLNEYYMGQLANLSPEKRKRFERGEYTEATEGALWQPEWIVNNRISIYPENITMLIVSIDPNVTDDEKATENTDEAGIITAGKYRLNGQDHYVVIRDDATPGISWGRVAVDTYNEYKADYIIAEVNNGGDLVKMNIRNYSAEARYDDVRASRGKEIRAVPVVDLYRRGMVHHLGEFPDLETELLTWTTGKKSPNRLDALVWAISYLSGNSTGGAAKVSGW